MKKRNLPNYDNVILLVAFQHFVTRGGFVSHVNVFPVNASLDSASPVNVSLDSASPDNVSPDSVIPVDKENTACAEPLATAEVDVALIQTESYTFLQDKKGKRPVHYRLVSFL
ncbi:hypothetical protein [Sporomusa malonica]|uniref:Uncharacterized protein n=1 Tax=Sporomusa malonica TaxID=112901 RepID=A0A1W1Y6Y6_9FIRM|nr:hypothetical protein [Sporomusa malonica]SMC31897.1 hypothetical protein SAMN04488500_10153 [Sporomusa malonica]